MPRNKSVKRERRHRRTKVFTDHDDRGESMIDSSSDDSRSSCDESGEDLKPISDYLRNRPEMVRQMFHAVPAKHLNTILPDVLKDVPLSELQHLCTEQLGVMSKKRIHHILAAKEMSSSSGTEESSSSEESVGEGQEAEPATNPKPPSSPELQQPDSTFAEQIAASDRNLPNADVIASDIDNSSDQENCVSPSTTEQVQQTERNAVLNAGEATAILSSDSHRAEADLFTDVSGSEDQRVDETDKQEINSIDRPIEISASILEQSDALSYCDDIVTEKLSVKCSIVEVDNEKLEPDTISAADKPIDNSQTAFDYGRATSPLDYDEDSCPCDPPPVDEEIATPLPQKIEKPIDLNLEDGEVDNDNADVDSSRIERKPDLPENDRAENDETSLTAKNRNAYVVGETGIEASQACVDSARWELNLSDKIDKLNQDPGPAEIVHVAQIINLKNDESFDIVRDKSIPNSGEKSPPKQPISEQNAETRPEPELKDRSVELYDSEHESGEYVSDEELCPPGLESKKPCPAEPVAKTAKSETISDPNEHSDAQSTKKPTNLVAIKTLYEHLKAEKQRKKAEPRPKKYGAQAPDWTRTDSQKIDTTTKEGPHLPAKSDFMLDDVTAKDRRNRQLYNELLDDYEDREKVQVAKERKVKKKSNIVLTEEFLADLGKKNEEHEQEMDRKARKLAKLKRKRLRLVEEEKEVESGIKKQIDLGLFDKQEEQKSDVEQKSHKRTRAECAGASANQKFDSPISDQSERSRSPTPPSDSDSSADRSPRSKISRPSASAHSSRLRSDRLACRRKRVVVVDQSESSASNLVDQSANSRRGPVNERDASRDYRDRAHRSVIDQSESSASNLVGQSANSRRGLVNERDASPSRDYRDRAHRVVASNLAGQSAAAAKAERMRRAFTLDSSSGSEEGEVEHEATVRGYYAGERGRSSSRDRVAYGRNAVRGRMHYENNDRDYGRSDIDYGDYYYCGDSRSDRQNYERDTKNSYSKTDDGPANSGATYSRRNKPDDYDSDYLKRDDEKYATRKTKQRKSPENDSIRVEQISDSEDDAERKKSVASKRAKPKSEKKQLQEKKTRLSRLVVDAAATAAKSASVPYDDCATNEALLLRKLELYELEMRARAIRALMKKQPKPD